MEIADFDVAVEDAFAIELEVELDCAVRGRMGRAHLDLHDLFGRIWDFYFLRQRAGSDISFSTRSAAGFTIGSISSTIGWRRLRDNLQQRMAGEES